ncbi:MAG: CHAT domain-containing protein [Bacteroidetes bacterium]|nr:CHAT domain-containing protein [Bacteroidota bacterium]MDA1120631.1 CHAT domain-containing protein [Bacteroidota bacterium]
MKNILKNLALITCLLFTGSNLVNAQFDKDLEKIVEEFDQGDYEGTLKDIERVIEKAAKKLGPNNRFLPVALSKRAMVQNALGVLGDVELLVREAVEKSKEINSPESLDHAFILKEATETLIWYENFLLAYEYLVDCRATFEKRGELTPAMEAVLDVLNAQILSGRGFNREALEYIDKQLSFYKEISESADGSKKENRLADREYATLMITKANTMRKMGDYLRADSAFVATENWILDHLNKADLSYSLNKYYNTQLLEENGLEVDVTIDLYEKAHTHLLRKYDASHWLAMELKNRIAVGYLKDERSGRFEKARDDYERTTKHNYPKNSVYNISMDLVEFDKRVQKSKTRTLNTRVATLLTNPAVPPNHIRRIELLEYALSTEIFKKNYTQAEVYLNQILEIKKVLYGDDSPEFHLSKLKLANFYVDYTDKFDAAAEIYQTSFRDFVAGEITEGHIDYIDILNHVATYYVVNDNYKEATVILEDALLSSRKKYDNEDMAYAIELEIIASLEIDIGNYDKAQEGLDIAKKILAKRSIGANPIYYAQTLITDAKLLAVKGLYDEAERNLKEAEEITKEAGPSLEVTSVSSDEDKAGLLINIGRLGEAEKILTSTYNRQQKKYGTESRFLIEPLVMLGELDLLKGNYSGADTKAQKANAISTATYGSGSTKNVKSINLLSSVHTAIGDYDIAEKYTLEALAILKQHFGQTHLDVGKGISQLALIKYYQGEDITEITRLFSEAEKIIGTKLGSKNPSYAEILKNLAIVNIANGEYDLAFSSLDEAEAIWKSRIGKRTNLNSASINILKGDIYYKRKQYNRADNYYSAAKDTYEEFFNSKHPEFVRVLSKLSRTYFMSGDLNKARKTIEEVLDNYSNFIEIYFPALNEREKAKFWNTIKSDYEFFNTLAVILSSKDDDFVGKMYNNALLTKALLLNSSIKIKQRILGSNDQKLIDLYNEWIDKKEIMTSILSMSIEELNLSGINSESINREVGDLEKELSLLSEFGKKDESVTWDLVQNALKPGEVAMEMVRFRHFDHNFTDSVTYAVLYINNDKRTKPKMILLNNGEDLEKRYLKYYRNSMKFRINDVYSYEAFWKPVDQVLGSVSKLYFSPDGVYNQINVESFKTPEGQYLVDKSNIILVSNTKDIFTTRLNPKKVQEERRATMVGNPKFYVEDPGPLTARASKGTRTTDAQVISQLPGTQLEIVELKSMLTRKGWNISEYLGSDATENLIKSVDNPRIFHIATHGFFQTETITEEELALNQTKAFENPLLRTGLLLTGAGDIFNDSDINYNISSGVLTAYEAMSLNLDQTEMVVLSACETGLGEVQAGEGVYGLQRAFMVAGAEAIVMSLFKVSDEATQKLMVSFYEKWLTTGNKRQSFLEAKKEVREEFIDPIYWAPFIMIGMTE